MTDDVERALDGLAEEPPPPEIVLAAVRTFRYRAIATVTAIIAAALLLGVAARAFGPANPGADAAAVRNPTIVPIMESAEYDGIEVAVTELVWDDGTGYVRVVVWDEGSHAEVAIWPVAITTSSGRRIELGPNPIGYVENYTLPDGRRIDRRTEGGWISFDDPDHDPFGPLTLETELVESPLEVVLEGGVLEGPFPRVVVEFEGLVLE